MASTTSATALDPFIADYLAHQRALGRAYNAEERVLRSLRDFVDDARAHDLNLSLFERWCATHASLTGNVRRGRQRVVRNFCLYRQRRDPACFIPDPNRFPRRSPHCTPVIVAPEAIGRMLDAADQVRASPDSPLRPHVLRLATALLYSAGLRRGELLRLQLGDIDAKAGVLRVRESKFHKSRWVPLSADATNELRRYLRHHMQWPSCTGPATPLLCHGARTAHGYTGTGLSAGLHDLMDAADVRGGDGRRPRLHDMRHYPETRNMPSQLPLPLGAWAS